VIILAVATPPVQLIDYPGSCQTSDGWFSDLANRPTSTAFVIYPGRHHTSGHILRLCPGRGHILRLCPGRLAGVDEVPWTVSQCDSECISRLHPSRVTWAPNRDPVVPPATKSGRRDFTTAARVGRLELKALCTTSRRSSGHIFRLCPGRMARDEPRVPPATVAEDTFSDRTLVGQLEPLSW
jgi:hypothetical protein